MSATPCVICTRNPPRDGATICDHCLARLDDNLARIAELVSWASNWLQPRQGRSNGGRSVPGSRPPLDVAALDAAMACDVLPVLESWERLTRETYGLAPYGPASLSRNAAMAKGGAVTPPVTVKGCVAFLRANVARIAETADYPIDDLARELRELTTSLEHLDPLRDNVDTDRSRLKCPAEHPDADGRNCGNWLLVDPERPREDITCRRCHTTWTSERLVLVALATPGDPIWMTAQPICAWLGVGAVTLNKWVRAGHVTRRGTLYNVQEAIAIVRTG